MPTLVANHSGAGFVASVRGLDAELAPFSVEEGAAVEPGATPLRDLPDLLTWADQTTGPGGEPLTLDQRLVDVLRRHGPDGPNARSQHRREPYRRAAVDRVERRRRPLLG